jgi:hypothetical protein
MRTTILAARPDRDLQKFPLRLDRHPRVCCGCPDNRLATSRRKSLRADAVTPMPAV